MQSNDYAKVLVAKESLDFIKDGMVVSLESGSTATVFIKLLGERVKRGLKIPFIEQEQGARRLPFNSGDRFSVKINEGHSLTLQNEFRNWSRQAA